MPEVLLSIPTLQISNGSLSDADTASTSSAGVTQRSTTSENSVSATEEASDLKSRRPNNGAQAKIKCRKSTGKRILKKPSLSVSCQQKNTAAALKLKSRIPRPLLLSPSPSSSSVTTDSNLRPSVGRSVITTQENLVTTVLQRQKSGIIWAYRQRKSISQMDIKHYRRNIQSPHSQKSGSNGALMATNLQSNVAFSQNDSSFVHKMYHFNEMGYGYGTPPDPRMAGMKIFATIMLNAWRKRRDEVKRLLEEVTELKRGSIKSRSQMHILNTFFRIEQKRNDELNAQLKRCLEDVNTIKSTCESLTTSIISLRADKALLEQQLQTKDHEFDSLSALLSQTKSELFKSMTIQRDLQANISMGQRKVQTLENQKNELKNEIFELNVEARKIEQVLRAEIQAKLDDLADAQKEICNLEGKLYHVHECKEKVSQESIDKQANLRDDIDKLEDEVKVLRSCLEKTLGKRIKKIMLKTVSYPGVTWQMLHWFAFCLLPATPPPKPATFPFGLSLDKVLSIIKR